MPGFLKSSLEHLGVGAGEDNPAHLVRRRIWHPLGLINVFFCWVWAATPPQHFLWVGFPGADFSGHLQEGAGADGVYGKRAQKGYHNLRFLPVPGSNKNEREV